MSTPALAVALEMTEKERIQLRGILRGIVIGAYFGLDDRDLARELEKRLAPSAITPVLRVTEDRR